MKRNTILAIARSLVMAVVVGAAGSLAVVDGAGSPLPGAPASAPVAIGPPDGATTTTGPDGHSDDTRPSTPAGASSRGDEPLARSTDRPGPADAGDRPAVAGPDVVPGAGSPPRAEPADPIGDLDDRRPVPAGLDLVAPPAATGSPNDHGGPSGLAVEPSCSHQCISRGIAYPRGFGAELIVETTVPATLFLTVVADLDGDGSFEDSHVESTPFAVTEHSWALDHLEPGQTYHVMAAATDADDHTAYVWGELTTLSQRDVVAVLGDGQIVGGPDNISATRWHLGLDGPLTDVTPGDQGILIYRDLPPTVDIDFWVLRSWDDDLCQAWVLEGAPPQGHSEESCVTWSSAQLDAVDLDTVPAGASRWTETTVAVSLHPPSGAGGALPPGYGDPYHFTFEVPLTLHVLYS